jgi:UDPglucose--hexose-1-phosphate uridylyltransferase
LSDGRELIFFDDVHTTRAVVRDDRDLARTVGASELRFNDLLHEWVVVASHRQERTHLPSAAECPLCPTSDRSTEIPADTYDVVVFENRFPSLSVSSQIVGPYDNGTRPAGGRCEVICFSSDHDTSFFALDRLRLATIGRALVDRTLALGSIDGVEYVLCFENRGEDIGVTLTHPHGQIYAYPYLPAKIERSFEVAAEYQRRHGACLMCTVNERELQAGERIVIRSDSFVAYVPFAARWPFEVHIAPLGHVADLPALEDDVLVEFLDLQAQVLAALDGVFADDVPYVAGVIQAPVRQYRDSAHLYVEVFSPRRAEGKLKYLAGSESAAGAFINDISPETAAETLRSAVAIGRHDRGDAAHDRTGRMG